MKIINVRMILLLGMLFSMGQANLMGMMKNEDEETEEEPLNVPSKLKNLTSERSVPPKRPPTKIRRKNAEQPNDSENQNGEQEEENTDEDFTTPPQTPRESVQINVIEIMEERVRLKDENDRLRQQGLLQTLFTNPTKITKETVGLFADFFDKTDKTKLSPDFMKQYGTLSAAFILPVVVTRHLPVLVGMLLENQGMPHDKAQEIASRYIYISSKEKFLHYMGLAFGGVLAGYALGLSEESDHVLRFLVLLLQKDENDLSIHDIAELKAVLSSYYDVIKYKWKMSGSKYAHHNNKSYLAETTPARALRMVIGFSLVYWFLNSFENTCRR